MKKVLRFGAAAVFVMLSVVTCHAARNDFDGDGKSDLAVYSSGRNIWFFSKSTEGFVQTTFDEPDAMQVTGDFDGDGRADFGDYNPSDGAWYLWLSSNGISTIQFGYAGTLPLPDDFDGDGKTDPAVYDTLNGNWYFMKSSNGLSTTQFGFKGALPATGDFDGDGRSDIAVYDPTSGNWYFMESSNGFSTTQFGFNGTIPFTGDFDGDGRCDFGVYDPSTSTWYLMRSTLGFKRIEAFGAAGYSPMVIGDYDGDGTDDIGNYDTDSAEWTILESTGGTVTTHFGQGDTFPIGTTVTQLSPPPPPPVTLESGSPWLGAAVQQPGKSVSVTFAASQWTLADFLGGTHYGPIAGVYTASGKNFFGSGFSATLGAVSIAGVIDPNRSSYNPDGGAIAFILSSGSTRLLFLAGSGIVIPF